MNLRTIGYKLRLPQRVKLRQPRKMADSFYNSPEWRALIEAIVRQRGRSCQDPAHDRTKASTGRVFGDHVIELRDGGRPLDRSNILLRCGSCHSRKTAAARANRYRGGLQNQNPSTRYDRAPSHARPIFGGGKS